MDRSLKLLIQILSDGCFRSGEELGVALGVTRAAVWKKLRHLSELGIEVESFRGRGYRLKAPLELLNEGEILSRLNQEGSACLTRLYCFDEIDSTNSFLLGKGEKGSVCIAERQSSGRGRRGRVWFSPYASNLYLSVCWRYSQGISVLEGLSLAVGVVVAEALEKMGVSGVELKWPNDLLLGGQKVGGVLIEIGGDLNGDCVVVVGLGLNVSMREAVSNAQENIGQPWTDLSSHGFDGGRSHLAAAIISSLLFSLNRYAELGFGGYRERWERRAAYLGEKVVLLGVQESVEGVMLGVDFSGALRVLTLDGERCVSGGEVSLRNV